MFYETTEMIRHLAGLAFLLCCSGAAQAESFDDAGWSLTGFGTFGAVSSSNHSADFVATFAQPNGAGATRDVAFGPDSRFGLQLDGHLAEHWSGTLQVVTQQQADGSYTPHVEWANVKYAISPDWSVRLGRIALPVLMESDYRLVGFANTAIRPPIEAYSILPGTSITGLDTTWRTQIGSATSSLQVFYGSFKQDFRAGASIRSTHTWGMGATVDDGPIVLHASISSAQLEWQQPATDNLLNGLEGFGEATAPIPGLSAESEQALALAQLYRVDGQRTYIPCFGISYDKDHWLAMSEWVRDAGVGLIPNDTGEYLTVAYRIGRFTPYSTAAAIRVDQQSATPIATARLPPPLAMAANELNTGVSSLLFNKDTAQHSRSLGTRWDLNTHVDFKFQIDEMKLGRGAPGLLINYQPGFQPGGTVYVYSLAMDFVF
jgi:hypothetical protein